VAAPEPDPEPDRATVPPGTLAPEEMPAIAELVARAWSGQPAETGARPSARLRAENHGVYVAARAGGVKRAELWRDGGTVGEALRSAVAGARDLVDAERRDAVDALEICVSHSYREARIRSRRRVLSNIHRGVRGLELRHDDHLERFSPTDMLARNLSYPRALQRYLAQHRLGDQDLAAGRVKARSFDCEQFLVLLAATPRAVPMLRGNTLVRPEEVTEARVAETMRLLGEWMVASLHEDGRMTYKWWPSRGAESKANNMIRQFMATLSLVRLADHLGDPELAALAHKNLTYNLETFYFQEGKLGLIECRGKIKLGALALAALAIVEHPRRADFAREEAALVRTTFHLQEKSGAFQTLLRPVDPRRPFQNFYPGEALLLWATLYGESRDPALLERIMRSFRYYREWHRENRNPAFVPWHTQAYFLVWRETRDPELSDFIFEMNDWLLGVQQWDDVLYPDTMGRFYDPDRSHFGPPHASSTGVYLEGLIDAYELAVELGEDERARLYRRAIARGLRSVMQLQFADEIDMYYISKRDAVRGGVRTTVYDNSIRVDNVQHNLLAILKIVKVFTSADYRL
jgi:hypothetical protein